VEVAAHSHVAIGEMAHIFGASAAGPRASSLTDDEKGVFENLIMLCPTCHTIIDKDERTFPDALIRKWKLDHAQTIADAMGTPRFDQRENARAWLEDQLLSNAQIHAEFGPDNEYRFDPETELSGVWKRKVIEQVIPRNRKILAALDHNSALLVPKERVIREKFRQHVDDLESYHVWGTVSVRLRFPDELNRVLRD